MKDMYENNLDISIQRKSILYFGREQELAFENYVLVHRWKPSDMTYSLYFESELRNLQRSFGHPSVTALQNLLKRAELH